MENINVVASYLHKKFKKQQSVEPRRNGANLDETRPTEEVNNRLIDNNKILVPKISTNCNETSSVNNLSSISHAATTSSNLCISFVVSNEPTNPLMSSNHTLLQTINNNNNNYIKNESDELEAPIKEEKSDDVLPPPDRNPNGKYVCTYCNLVCSKPSVLQKHIRAHTNERPYPCTSCGFSFKTRSNLYKHCRSRTHANRVMGNKAAVTPPAETTSSSLKSKPYKPRFHQHAAEFEPQGFDDDEEDKPDDDVLSHHINEIITKNSSFEQQKIDEPLNLSSKNRKRCLSEFATENGVQKSLIKELLLKNLCSDMQCPYCKMIFQTVTELELHKLRSCKCKPSNVKYTRSSSVNVASILTHNKNAFDTLPQLQNTIFPLNSPGPFLGKTRLVDGEKCKSFSFDDNIRLSSLTASASDLSPSYLLSPSPFERKMPVKLFGGEVKITHTSGETKSFKIDQPNEEKYETNDLSNNYSMDYNLSKKLSENRVIKSSLQSGGTVLTNRHSVSGSSGGGSKYLNQDVIRVYDNSAMSPSIDMNLVGRTKFTFEHNQQSPNVPEREALQLKSPSYKYPNINDFSQNAVKMLMPNIKQLNNMLPKPKFNQNNAQLLDDLYPPKDKLNFARKEKGFNPVNLMIDGKVVRYVPGIPGPAVPASPRKLSPIPKSVITENPSVSLSSPSKPTNVTTMAKSSSVLTTTTSVLSFVGGNKKFARPNSLALKPTNASLKQHHGLTPTMWNQILISPETPRVAKKYEQHCLQGNYFSFLGLKSSTRPVYCTLNKTQPFYVPHFKKLSMYSEWRQQDTKTDKLYVSSYDSRQKGCKYTMAGKTEANLIIHSSYKFVVSELPLRLSSEEQKQTSIPGGYESLEDYTYIRGRGRGRYVCDQCGIRCKKPSMLKKHIRTHSNDRPYTCNHCNFSFKTKGNLTKHMKSKAHTKNYTASSSGSSTQQSGTQSEDSGSDDSGMDSSDESSTRQQEHEAAYGLLSLSQKTTQSTSSQLDHISTSPLSNRSTSPTLNNVRLTTEEIAHMSQRNYAKNKILDENNFSASITCNDLPMIDDDEPKESSRCHLSAVLGISTANRPLTYPYITTILQIENDTSSIQSTPEKSLSTDASTSDSTSEPKCIKQFHVIQKYAMEQTIEKPPQPESVPITTKNDVPIMTLVQSSNINRPSTIVSAKSALPTLKLNGVIIDNVSESRKRKMAEDYEYYKMKVQKGDVQAETNDEVMDLSMTTVEQEPKPVINGTNYQDPFEPTKEPLEILNQANESNGLADEPATIYVGQSPPHERIGSPKSFEFDNSAMETLADVATKQVKLEKNTLAKSVASEFLKLAIDGVRESGNRFSHHVNQDVNVNDLIVKPEGNKSCTVCLKSFSKMSQLRLHMNIHYLERPFRCDSCSVSFRTKGHLQKHERSASHHSKLSSSPALSSSEPRPFKCTDCSIAFRIHGHLHKHLRSKVHIMKLECLGKIPFGLYAELERSNSLLTEINTCDGDQCLNSLKALAKKVFINDPNRLNHIGVTEHVDVDS